MSEARRRKGGRARKLLPLVGWVLALALAAHLVIAELRSDGDVPQGFITPDAVRGLGFWAAVIAAAGAAVCGFVWSWKAHSRTERSSLAWARRAFVFALVGTVGFVMAAYEPELLPREWLVVAFAGLWAAQTAFFAAAAFREFRRSTSAHRRHEEGAPASSPSLVASDADTGEA